MRNRTLNKCVRYDLRVGLKGNILKYLLALLYLLLRRSCFSVGANGRGQRLSSGLPDLFYRGMQVYIPTGENPFPIPVVWLMLQLVVSFLILSYPTQDLESYGMQFLVRTRKRGVWWISKSIWNILSVALFYLIGIFVAFIFPFCWATGRLPFTRKLPCLSANLAAARAMRRRSL